MFPTAVILVVLSTIAADNIFLNPSSSRCGEHFPVWASGKYHPTGCKTDIYHPIRCCSPYSWCGSSPAHCCSSCPKYHYHNITTTFRDEVEFARFRFKSGGSHANCSQSLESVNIAFLNSLSFTVDQDSVKVDMYSCFGQNRGIKEDEDFEVNF